MMSFPLGVIPQGMPFTSRNAFYLRISNSTVLPTYVYLDERHVQWMSDTILQFVLSDLRPCLLSKLGAEADIILGGNASKKSTVDTHRGETYQFCYFLRKTDPHSVIVKSRRFRAVQKREEHPPRRNKKGKRKENPVDDPSQTIGRKKRRTNDDDGYTVEDDTEDEFQGVTNMLTTSGDDHVLVDDTGLEVDEEEEKPKPALSLRYQGFNIYGHCLCIVVEPWPVVRTVSVSSNKGPTFNTTNRPQNRHTSAEPLFLPDDVDVEGSTNISANIGQFVNKSYLEQILSDNEVEDEDEDNGGMIEFSQVLQNIGDSRAGAMNDDDDMDGSVLFGDADEQREL